MSGRTHSYLSIGDVLTLLRQEFPDVTISKIRFLESQGLVNPERTPSGYRKFYEHDVERLRWVLRQQREHFLPLKVIKGRLEQEGVDGFDDDTFDTDVDGFDADADAAYRRLRSRPRPVRRRRRRRRLRRRRGGGGARRRLRPSRPPSRRPSPGEAARHPGQVARGPSSGAAPSPSSSARRPRSPRRRGARSTSWAPRSRVRDPVAHLAPATWATPRWRQPQPSWTGRTRRRGDGHATEGAAPRRPRRRRRRRRGCAAAVAPRPVEPGARPKAPSRPPRTKARHGWRPPGIVEPAMASTMSGNDA